VVLQRRYCFLWQGKTYSLYRYLGHAHQNLAILHCQAEWRPKDGSSQGADGGPAGDNVGAPEIPPFLAVTGPLDEDGPYSAYRLSLKSAASPLGDRFQTNGGALPLAPPEATPWDNGMPPRAKSTSALPRAR
jgi:hypothetical protein